MDKIGTNTTRDTKGVTLKIINVERCTGLQERSNLPVIHLFMIENTLVDANAEDYIGEDGINISKPIYHFSWIKNISRLICLQITRNEHQILIHSTSTYFEPRRLLILRLRRVGYPLHKPSIYSSLQLPSPQNWREMQTISQLFTNNQ